VKWIVSKIIVFLISIYQLSIYPFLCSNCRYQPTCSQYSVDAVNKYGPLKGGWLALKRISSCHPWGGHGHDPVP